MSDEQNNSPWSQPEDAPVHEHRKTEVTELAPGFMQIKAGEDLGEVLDKLLSGAFSQEEVDRVSGPRDDEFAERLQEDERAMCQSFRGESNQNNRIQMFVNVTSVHSMAHTLNDHLPVVFNEDLFDEMNVYMNEQGINDGSARKLRITLEIVE